MSIPTVPVEATASLGTFLRLLWRRKVVIVLAVVIAAASAYAVDREREPVYEASTDLLFTTANGDGSSRAVSIPTEARVATSPAVLAEARERLGHPLDGSIEAGQAGDIAVLRIHVRHGSPTAAAEVAEAVAAAYLEERNQRAEERLVAESAQISARLADLGPEIDRLAAQVAAHQAAGQPEQAAVARQQMNVVAGEQAVQQARLFELRAAAAGAEDEVTVLVPAEVPSEPTSPRPRRSAVIGGLVGLLVGLGLALAREHLGATVRRSGEVESLLGVPVLGVVPRMGRRQLKKAPVVVLDPAHPDAAEPYRILRSNLIAAGVGDELRVLVVTSSVSAEGKSTTAANVAAAFAEAGVNTLLVDADLRRPQVHRLFDRPNAQGLSSLIDGSLGSDAIRSLLDSTRVSPTLSVLPAGPVPARPAQLVAGGQLERVVAALRSTYLLVIDVPPVLPVADAAVLMDAADAVLVIVRPDLARKPMVAELRTRLAQVNAPVIGAVINAADRSSYDNSASYRYYGGYGSAPSHNGHAGAFSKLIRSGR